MVKDIKRTIEQAYQSTWLVTHSIIGSKKESGKAVPYLFFFFKIIFKTRHPIKLIDSKCMKRENSTQTK